MTVLGGFLGAGKTTLLNRILAGPHGVRYAVLVNDFGELNVDGDLVAAHDGDTLTFANGCVCCSMGDGLVDAIDRLLDGPRPPDRILVEASGVADPAAIADVATLHPGLGRDLVVVLADTETLRARHSDHRLRETVTRQLDAADLVVLNKCDRVREPDREATEAWVRRRARAPLLRSVDADVPLALLSGAWTGEPAGARAADGSFGPPPDAEVPAAPGEPGSAAVPGAVAGAAAPAAASASAPAAGSSAPGHRDRFASRTVSCPDPIDLARLREALTALLPRLLRAKGFVLGAGRPEPAWMIVQVCGRTVELAPWKPPPDEAPPAPNIVFIGLDDLPGEEALARAVRGKA